MSAQTSVGDEMLVVPEEKTSFSNLEVRAADTLPEEKVPEVEVTASASPPRLFILFRPNLRDYTEERAMNFLQLLGTSEL